MSQSKPKPCKGIGPAKDFKGCGKETMHRVHGLGKMCCYPKWLLDTPAGNAKMERATLKATKPRREMEKLEKETKERKGITTLLNDAKKACHEFIRSRDHGKPCISCGTPYKSDFDAGHYYKAELFSSLKFNENNIHGQCVYCNRRLEGNLNMYEMRLPERIGLERFEDLKHMARMDKRNGEFKWDREKLKEIKKYYRTKIKELKII